MTHRSYSALLVLSAALAACNGQVLDVGSTGQPLVQGNGGGGPVPIATLTRVPVTMTSDGQNLYWTDDTTAVVEMPVQGGTTTTVVSPCSLQFLAVDSTNVYFIRALQLNEVPKKATTELVISDGSGSVTAAAVRSGQAFWAETPNQHPMLVAVKSVSVTDRVTSPVAEFPNETMHPPFQMGVTSHTVFLATARGPLTAFSLNGGPPDGGSPQTLGSSPCGILLSDGGAAYCIPPGGSVTRTGDDGMTIVLTTVTSGTAAALDETYLYF